MGYVRTIICCAAFADDGIVFVIFLAVRPSQQSSSLSKGRTQNRYLPIGYQTWVLIGEWDHDFPCHTKSTLTSPVAASYRPTFSQRVSNIVIGCNELADQIGLSCMTIIHNTSNHKVSHTPFTAAIRPPSFLSSRSQQLRYSLKWF